MQASRFWAAGSDSEDESESSVEETSSEDGSGSSSSSSDAGGAKGPSRWGIAAGAQHQWQAKCWPCGLVPAPNNLPLCARSSGSKGPSMRKSAASCVCTEWQPHGQLCSRQDCTGGGCLWWLAWVACSQQHTRSRATHRGGALGADLATTRWADRILCAQGCLQLTWAGAVGRSPHMGHPRAGVRASALARPSLCEQQLYVQAHTLRHQSALPSEAG